MVGTAYRYSAYCQKYRAWAERLKRSMRPTSLGGKRLFVGCAGQTVTVGDAATGEIRRPQVFVAVLDASNCTCACASWQQTATGPNLRLSFRWTPTASFSLPRDPASRTPRPPLA